MCLILFSYKDHPKYKLALAANRDEFYARPTESAHWRPEAPEVLAGKDLQAGGGWLGLSKGGRIAALTNFRGGNHKPAEPPSRGEIVSDFLFEKHPVENYLHLLEGKGKNYQGFNVVLGEIDQLFYYSNMSQQSKPIEPGVHGLSNHLLDTPWPKVRTGCATLAQIFNDLDENATDQNTASLLFEMLKNEKIAPDADLPSTGVGLELERVLSPLFIQSPVYGTRASTVVLVDHENNVYFEERSYVPQTERIFEFRLNPPA